MSFLQSKGPNCGLVYIHIIPHNQQVGLSELGARMNNSVPSDLRPCVTKTSNDNNLLESDTIPSPRTSQDQ